MQDMNGMATRAMLVCPENSRALQTNHQMSAMFVSIVHKVRTAAHWQHNNARFVRRTKHHWLRLTMQTNALAKVGLAEIHARNVL